MSETSARSPHCACPYLPCKIRGICSACTARHIGADEMVNCSQEAAARLGAKLPLKNPPTVLCADATGVAIETAARLKEILSRKPNSLFCLPAGESARETYQLLADMAQKGEIDFSQARFVQLDEWLGLEQEDENCSAFLHRHLYGPAGIRADQVKSFLIHEEPALACADMDAYLKENGPIDLMLLGIGMNGHLGLNEPGVDWDQYAAVIELDDTTRSVGQKYFQNGMELKRGITLGIRYLFESIDVILQVSGKHKASIMQTFYTTAPAQKLPATAVKLVKRGLVIADEAALGTVDRALIPVTAAGLEV